MTSRHWVFTSFDFATDPVFEPGLIRYLVYQWELCPDTNNIHIQGYAELHKPSRRRQFQETIGHLNAHCETRRGTRDQARAYACKSETRFHGPFEYGTWNERGTGARTDIRDAIKLGSVDAIKDHAPEVFVKYPRGITEVFKREVRQRESRPLVIWMHGRTGTGKSWTAREVAGPGAYWKDSTKWWDGYGGQESVVIDEYGGGWSMEYLLQLLDQYPCRVESKGGSMQFNSPLICITSHAEPSSFAPGGRWPELRRRIGVIINMDVKKQECSGD